MRQKDEDFEAEQSEQSERPQNINGVDISSTPDGGSVIDFNPQQQHARSQPEGHSQNLASIISSHILTEISAQICEGVEEDLESRVEWEENLAESIDQLGYTNQGSGEEDSEVNDIINRIFSTAYPQALEQTIAGLTGELLPPSGPVAVSFYEKIEDKRFDMALQLEKQLNHYLVKKDKAFYPDTQQAIRWLVLQGSVFKKVYLNPNTGMPVSRFIKPEYLVVNYGCSDLSEAERVTNIDEISFREMRIRQLTGLYIDQDIVPYDQDEVGSVQQALDRITGQQPISNEYNKRYRLYESQVMLDLEGFEDVDEQGEHTRLPLPYLVTIDTESKKVMAIYRDWDEHDPKKNRKQLYIHYCMNPGFGFYGLGYSHLLGAAAYAATQILRQEILTGMYKNFPGGLRMKGTRNDDNDFKVSFGEFKEIDTSGMPINQVFSAFPYQEPSQALISLQEKLENNIAQLAGSTNTATTDLNPNAPATTTLALLEELKKPLTAVMQRLHSAFSDEFTLLAQLMATQGLLPVDAARLNEFNISSISNPNMSSKLERLLRAKAIKETAQEMPDLFNMRAVATNTLKSMQVDDIEEFLLPEQKEEEILPLDPITENQNAIQGKPVKAAIWQNHQAHIAVHQSFVEENANNPNAGSLSQTMMAHIQEHTAFLYALQMEQRMGTQLPDNLEQVPPHIQNNIAMAAAQVVQQMQQEKQEQAPIDPTQVMLEDVKVKAATLEARIKDDQAKNQAKIRELEERMKLDHDKLQLEKYKADLNYDAKMKELELKVEELSLKRETELHNTEESLNNLNLGD